MSFIVIDYSKGNLRSVQKGLALAGAEAVISASTVAIRAADALILPGVGSFADASAALLASGQMQALRERIGAGVPFLGICLGMQLLFEQGNEGAPPCCWSEGLGVLPGVCTRIAAVDAAGRSYKVPHVGWNQVIYQQGASKEDRLAPLFGSIEDGSYFYFTHSYQCEPKQKQEVLATVTHAETLPSVVHKEQVYGVQFHPEKSSSKGLEVMKNFVRFAQRA